MAKRTLSAILVVQAAISGPAIAAGFGLKEHSAEAMGSAYAGAAASDRDASSVFYNPAALLGVQTTDFSISAIEILPTSSAKYSTATTAAGTPASGSTAPSGFIGDASVPNIAIRHRLSDDWAVGLDVSVPFGLKTNYPGNWAGRYYALKTSAVTVAISPSIAYQLTPTLSVGASAQIEYARGQLVSAIDIGSIGASFAIPGAVPGALDGSARLSGMDWSEGFSIGAIDKITPELSVGLSYQSAVDHNLNGPLTFNLDPAGLGAAIRSATGLFANTRASAKLNTPDMIMFGARDKLDDRWTALFELDWTNWTRFHNLTVVAQNPQQPNDVTLANWHGTVFASAGAEYAVDDNWKLRGGVGYDESPIPNSTRNARIPDANRTWMALGTDYRLSPTMALSVSIAHLFNSDEPIALSNTQSGNALRGNLSGITSSAVNTVGLQLAGSL